jgi:citrate synthase
MTTEVYHPGLEGVIAGETAISTVTDGLRYRGYPVTELAEKTTYEEVAYLLLYGRLPTARQLADFRRRLAGARRLPEPLLQLFGTLPPNPSTMDVLRSAVSVLAHFDPDSQDSSHEANLRKAERLLGQIPVAIAAQYRINKGLPPVPAREDLSQAANFLYQLRGIEPTPAVTCSFDVALILYAEHEFNASAFTVRVVCSTEADLHSAVVAAIGALKGRLHGGANEKVAEMLQAIGGPEHAEQWVHAALARKERIMGFGHRVLKTGDVRAAILKPYVRRAAEAAGEGRLEQAAEVIEKILVAEKNLHPNVDWPAGRLFHALGLETPLYTPIFTMARVAGWSAHFIEQHEHNRLIRPRSRYIGPELQPVVPLTQRG